MSNVWDENEDFRDMPVERDSSGNWVESQQGGPPSQPRPRAPARQVAPQNPRAARAAARQQPSPVAQEPELQYDEQAITSPEEDDFTEVLSDASLRLEQGNLYKLIMNNNLFAGADADPRAVKNVEREIKRFARERMEVMLGMRQEKQIQQYNQHNAELAAQSPFNGLEVRVLKQVAAAASKGATERPEAEQIAKKIEKTTISPISVPKPKVSAPAPATAQKQPQPLPKKTAPLERGKKLNLHELEAQGRGINDKLAEQLVDKVMDGGVDVDGMSEDDLAAHNATIAERRQARVKAAKAKPTPSIDQTNMMYTEQAGSPQIHSSIASIINLMKK